MSFCYVWDIYEVLDRADVSILFLAVSVSVITISVPVGLLVSPYLESRLPDITLSLSENIVTIYLGRFRPDIKNNCFDFFINISSFVINPILTSNFSI